MAQVLKENVRNDILNSAKDEFLYKGVKEASMRDIAKGANVTVGNLYRYFHSKEEIAYTIIHRPLLLISQEIERITDEKVSFNKEVVSIDFKEKNIQDMLIQIADVITDIYKEYPKEMLIFMRDDESNERFKNWLTMVVSVLLKESAKVKFSSADIRDTYAYAISTSIFYGIKECFIDDFDKTRELISEYLLSILGLLKLED